MKAKFFIPVLLLGMGCAKEQKPVETGSVKLQFEHHVDGTPLEFDNVYFTNAAGNRYRVTLLVYIISGVTLYSDGEKQFTQKSNPEVITANYADDRDFTLGNIPVAHYDSISFSLGVIPELNYDGAFPLGYNDLGMYWPTSMGGGYHFMRFEGHWNDGDQFGGFAFHLGQNENLITVGFPLQLEVASAKESPLTVFMNLNQWFEDPYLYDLKNESGYTMGDTAKMNMLVRNGHSVFTINKAE